MSVSRLYKSWSTTKQGFLNEPKCGGHSINWRDLNSTLPWSFWSRLNTFTWVTFWASSNPTCVLASKNNSIDLIWKISALSCASLHFIEHYRLLRLGEGCEGCSCTPGTQLHINGMVRTSAELEYFSFMNSKNLKHDYPNKSFQNISWLIQNC